MTTYIAYYRVSTKDQGKNGHGLDAQKQTVRSFVKDAKLFAEYTEIESGRKDDRPELQKAIEHANQSSSRLVIAKLDRLSRDVHFLTGLEKAGVDFVACDMQSANRVTVRIMACIAEEEAHLISKRTKEGLAAAKAKGIKLGTPANATPAGRRKGAAISAANRRDAAAAKRKQYGTLIREFAKTLLTRPTAQQIADHLNSVGRQTAAGKAWTAQAVANLKYKARKERRREKTSLHPAAS